MTVSSVSSNSVLDGLSIQSKQDSEAEKTTANDKNMFMNLLLAQLKNQDPLNPTDQKDFVAQLAQFSTLEGIQNLNTTVQDIGSMYRSSQALQATALVGRDVLATGKKGYLDAGGTVSGYIDAGQAAGDVTLTVKDASGAVVATRDLGNVGDAATPFEWDGKDNNGNALSTGTYTLGIEGQINGDNAALITSIYNHVNSVSIVDNEGGMVLNLAGIGQIDSSDIQEVR